MWWFKGAGVGQEENGKSASIGQYRNGSRTARIAFSRIEMKKTGRTMGSRGELAFAAQLGERADWEREYAFCPPRRYRFDFANRKLKLAVEIEGGTWIQGRHNRASSIEADFRKYNLAACLGWKILRGTTAMAESGELYELVKRWL